LKAFIESGHWLDSKTEFDIDPRNRRFRPTRLLL